MATFSDLESQASVRAKINAAITKVDAADALGNLTARRFDTVQDLLDYSTTPRLTVGSYVEAGGFRYLVVSSGEDVTTAGADKLTVQAGANGMNVKAFGAVGDGTTDDTAAIQAAIESISATGGTVYFPQGTYVISSTIELPGRVCLMGEESGGLTYNTYSAVIFSYTGTNSACITHTSPYRNSGIHNILVNCNNGANTTAFKFPSALYCNYSNLFALNCYIGYDMTSITGADGIIFNEFKNIGARNCTIGMLIDGTLAAHSANQIEVGNFLNCTVAIDIIECGSSTLLGERGEIGNNTIGIRQYGGTITLDGEFWMEVNSTADIIQTGGFMAIAKPFRSLGKIQTSLPGIMLSSNHVTPYKVLPSLSINRSIVNNAYSFRSRSDVVDVMAAQNMTLVNGAASETSVRTKFGSGIEFVAASSRRLTLPAGYFRFDSVDWCMGFLVKLNAATSANLFKLEGSDPDLDRLSVAIAANQNYGQFLRTETNISGSVTGLDTSYEWFTDDYPHWFFIAYDASETKLMTWEPRSGLINAHTGTCSLAHLGSSVQLTVGQGSAFGSFTLDELVIFNTLPDNYTLQAIARSGADLKSMLT